MTSDALLAMKKNLKVVHLVQDFPVLSETFILNEAVHLMQLGVEVKLLAFNRGGDYPTETDDKLSQHLSSVQERCVYINRFRPSRRLRGLNRLLNFLYGFLAGLASPVSTAKLGARVVKGRIPLRKSLAIILLARYLLKDETDILHAQFGHLGLLCLPVKSLLGLPLVTSFRGQDVSIISRLNAKVSQTLFTEGEIFLVRSQDMRADLVKLGCPDEKIRVNHSSVDLDNVRFAERRPPPAGSDAVILFVGRFVEKKGLRVAVEAFGRCLAKHPNSRFRLIGGGELESEIESLVESLGLSQKIGFLGPKPRSEVIAEMEKAHIFLLPCQMGSDGEKEGIPKTLMEAQASGMPVVSTFHAGIPECVIDGKTGLLAKEGDADDVAEKLIRLLEHPESWRGIGRSGREHIERKFSIQQQTAELANIYEELVSK